MRFSAFLTLERPILEVLEVAKYVDSTGWDGVWLPDHFMTDDDARAAYHESLTTISAVAATTSRVRIGSLVAGNLWRHPGVLANMASTIDHISRGRFTLGLGAGWQLNEHQAYGVKLTPPKERLDQLEEACIVLRSMFRQRRTSFSGSYYEFDDAPLEPRPIQTPIPLLIGGWGERRTLQIAARYGDQWNYMGPPDLLEHKLEVLDEHCAREGRDPADIWRSTSVTVFMTDDPEDQKARISSASGIFGSPEEIRDIVAHYRQLGIDEFILADFNLGDLDARKRTYDIFMEKVASEFR